MFESAFPAVGAADWACAEERIGAAIAISRRSGYALPESWFTAHLGWVARQRGQVDRALACGRRAVALAAGTEHRWYATTGASLLAGTLLELGRTAEAVRLLIAARERAQVDGAEAYLLRCLAPLAEATGSAAVLAEADALLAGIDAPPGSAWLLGTDSYLAIARCWLRHGDPARARAVLAPLLAAADRQAWVPAQAAGALVDGRAAAALGLGEQAAQRGGPGARAGHPARAAARRAAGPGRGGRAGASGLSRARPARTLQCRGRCWSVSARRGGIMRARLPDHEGRVERDGVSVGYEVFGPDHAGPDHPAADLVGHRALPAVEGPGALPGPAPPGDHRRGPRQRPGGPAPGPGGLPRPRVRGGRDRRPGRHRHRSGRDRRAVAGRPARAAARGVAPGPGGRRDRHRDRAAVAGARGLHRAAGRLRGLAEVQPALLAGRLPRLGRVLHVPGLHRAALDQAVGGRRRVGAGHRRRDAAAHRAGAGRADRGGRRGDLPAGALPGADRARRRGRDRALRDRGRAGRMDRGQPGHHPRWRARPDHARSGVEQPADPRVRRVAGAAPRRAGAPGPAGAAAAGGPCSPRRRSGSGTRGATWPSPTSCGSGTRTWRSTG